MLEALIVTLREGVEAALVIGIAVAYLKKSGRRDLLRWVYAGLVAALAGSVVLGIAFAKMKWNQDRFEGYVMLAAAVLVASMVYMMWRAGKTMKLEIETGLHKAFASKAAGPGLMLFVFLMILREGVETILLLAAVSLNSADLWNIAGTMLGAGLAAVFGVLFVRGSVRVDLAKFFRMTSVILSFVAFQLVVMGYHELAEQGIVPATKAEMAWIGPIARNEEFFLVAIIALAVLMILLDWRGKSPAQAVAGNAAASVSAADRRLAVWTARRERLWMSLMCAASFVFIVMVTAQFIYAKSKSALSPARNLVIENGSVRIPVAELADGDLHRYQLQTPSGMVRFFAVNVPGWAPALAADACMICGTAGYGKQGPNVICKHCGAAMNLPSIGTEGGCNPIPLRHTFENGELRIAAGDLEKAAKIFTAEAPSPPR